MKTFVSPRRRAHRARVGPGMGYKFVGGRLVVSDEAAPEVRAYAAAHPEIGIFEILPRGTKRRRGQAAS